MMRKYIFAENKGNLRHVTAADHGGEAENIKNQRGFSLQNYAVGDIIHLIHKLVEGFPSDNCHHNWKNIIMHPLRIRRIHHCGAKAGGR